MYMKYIYIFPEYLFSISILLHFIYTIQILFDDYFVFKYIGKYLCQSQVIVRFQ